MRMLCKCTISSNVCLFVTSFYAKMTSRTKTEGKSTKRCAFMQSIEKQKSLDLSIFCRNQSIIDCLNVEIYVILEMHSVNSSIIWTYHSAEDDSVCYFILYYILATNNCCVCLLRLSFDCDNNSEIFTSAKKPKRDI